jgi:hypothetical protein
MPDEGMSRLRYLADNWKLIVHLLLRTYRFGVNNHWWCSYRSIFGLPWHRRFRLIQSYRMARFRAVACHFVGPETQRLLFS